jgi:GntR family transcriptional regulator of arabinose operon
MQMAVFTQGIGAESEAVLVELRRDLQSGRYEPGDRLPSERKLAARFDVSRSTVRRAVERLVHEGMIDVRRGAGMYVTDEAAPPGVNTISVMYEFRGTDLTYVQDRALERGCMMAVFSQRRHQWDHEAERKFLRYTLRNRHRGLVAHCSPLGPLNEDLLEEMHEEGIPVVHVEHYRTKLPDQSYLLPDYERAGYMGAVRLILAGYERVVLVGTMLDAPFFQLVEQGFAKALEDHQSGYDRQKHMFWLKPGLGSRPEVARSVREFGRRCGDSTGLLCVGSGIGDLLAPRYREMGIRIPDELGLLGISLVGADGETTDTLDFDRRAILRRAIDAVTERGYEPVEELMPPRKVVRGTVRNE